jgi:Pentapeptide repeats (8 copies)
VAAVFFGGAFVAAAALLAAVEVFTGALAAADLAGALAGADLAGAALAAADLAGADLAGADLAAADLAGADLAGADLAAAALGDALVVDAGAVLAGALLAAAFVAGLLGVALVDFDGTNEPLAGRASAHLGHRACEVRRCARGVPTQHCHTARAFPSHRARGSRRNGPWDRRLLPGAIWRPPWPPA